MARSTQRDFQARLQSINKAAVRFIAQETGARSEPVRKAAVALARAWRGLLGTPARNIRVSLKNRRFRGEGSAPGQPPARLSGASQKSISTAVVDGIRRVGTSWFKLRLLETGVSATVSPRVSPKGRRAGKRKIAVRGGTYQLTIAPRPHAAKALELAQPRMEEVFVGELQARTTGGIT